MLAGTDNDYSVTQNAGGAQFDVYFRVSDPDPYLGSIQCPLGAVTGCFSTTGGAPATLPNDGRYRLLPAVLHAYKVPASDLIGFVPAEPPIPGCPEEIDPPIARFPRSAGVGGDTPCSGGGGQCQIGLALPKADGRGAVSPGRACGRRDL